MQTYDLVGRSVITNMHLYNNEHGAVTVAPLPLEYAIDPMHDSYGRRINYLRISLTDACNLRCVYCMPEHMQFQARHALMTDDEILTLVRVGASLGVNKIRLTGGEPTIRPGIVDLVRAIAHVPGIQDLAMTTNGVLLDKLARPLADAGLQRANISIDTLDAGQVSPHHALGSYRRCVARHSRRRGGWADAAQAQLRGRAPLQRR